MSPSAKDAPKMTATHLTAMQVVMDSQAEPDEWHKVMREIVSVVSSLVSSEWVAVPRKEIEALREKTLGVDGSSLRDVYLATNTATSRWLGVDGDALTSEQESKLEDTHRHIAETESFNRSIAYASTRLDVSREAAKK